MVHGQLDLSMPRPVKNGRVVAHVWPAGLNPGDSPPQWHAWSPVSQDGRFVFGPLPDGDLELVALCAGYISTNGPGQSGMRYPQKFLLETNDLTVTLGMEPTARLEVEVLDDHNRPLKGAQVMTWPNVRYGESAAVILAADCYNYADSFLKPTQPQVLGWADGRRFPRRNRQQWGRRCLRIYPPLHPNLPCSIHSSTCLR